MVFMDRSLCDSGIAIVGLSRVAAGWIGPAIAANPANREPGSRSECPGSGNDVASVCVGCESVRTPVLADMFDKEAALT